jgi:capsular exopolysaccharide synthesis family protein
MQNISQKETSQQSISDLLKPYLRRWWWLVVSVSLFLGAAYTYLRYADSIYQATASILIKSEQSSGGVSEMQALGGLGVFGSNMSSTDNDIQILSSRRMMLSVVKKLNLNTNIYQKGTIKKVNLYNAHPIVINVIQNNSQDSLLYINTAFDMVIKNDSTYDFRFKGQENYKNYSFGHQHSTKSNNFSISPSDDKNYFNNHIGNALEVEVVDPTKANLGFVGKLKVISLTGTALRLTIADEVPARAEDILNELVTQFNLDAINDKNLISNNTAIFIEQRLKAISKQLDTSEIEKQNFTKSLGVASLEEGAVSIQAGLEDYEKKLTDVQMESEILASYINYVTTANLTDPLPINLVISSAEVNTTVNTYNASVLRYKKLLETSTLENPAAINLRNNLLILKESIVSSLKGVQRSLNMNRAQLASQTGVVKGKIAEAPTTERLARGIERERAIIESIYLYLLQKKEETAIALAITSPKAKIVDKAYPSGRISPNTTAIYGGSAVAGVILPVGIIFLMVLFYNKIESRKDVENALPNVTILGEIPEIDKNTTDHVMPNDRSVLAESFRIIRTNLQYKLSALDHDGTKAILVTSTVKGEGKTMVSFNIASTFAYAGKKVILIGGDIRNPQLHRYFKGVSKRTKGVTEYLTQNDLTIKDLAFTSTINSNLDVMLSGAIPPNPAELLIQNRTNTLFEEAKANYDLVVIDSAPTILVTDTLLINKYADVITYVTRANYTDTSLLDFVSDSINEGKLTNVSAIVNDVKLANFGYGNKYGYSYGNEKKTLTQKLKAAIGKG